MGIYKQIEAKSDDHKQLTHNKVLYIRINHKLTQIYAIRLSSNQVYILIFFLYNGVMLNLINYHFYLKIYFHSAQAEMPKKINLFIIY